MEHYNYLTLNCIICFIKIRNLQHLMTHDLLLWRLGGQVNDWMDIKTVHCIQSVSNHQGLLHWQHESMSNVGGKGGEGGRNLVGVSLRQVNQECISFCLQSYPFPSSPLKKHTKQHDRRECKQRTRDRQQGISNVDLLWPSDFILNTWLIVLGSQSQRVILENILRRKL